MRQLTAGEILRIWEQGARVHPVDRALVILGVTLPRESWKDLAELGVGERDTKLMSIRERTFGSVLQSYAECPACSERLEFSLSLQDLVREPAPESIRREVEVNGMILRYRIPDSFDLAAIATCRDPEQARRQIARRCTTLDDGAIPTDEILTDGTLELLSKSMAESDPNVDITLDLICPVCSGRWEMVLDILSYLWSEIEFEAKRLLRDVHTLARAYGWSESEILGLSAARRQAYLEMVG